MSLFLIAIFIVRHEASVTGEENLVGAQMLYSDTVKYALRLNVCCLSYIVYKSYRYPKMHAQPNKFIAVDHLCTLSILLVF